MTNYLSPLIISLNVIFVFFFWKIYPKVTKIKLWIKESQYRMSQKWHTIHFRTKSSHGTTIVPLNFLELDSRSFEERKKKKEDKVIRVIWGRTEDV